MPVGMIDGGDEDLLDELQFTSPPGSMRTDAVPPSPLALGNPDTLDKPLLNAGAPLAHAARSPSAAPRRNSACPKILCAILLLSAAGGCVFLFTRMYLKQEAEHSRGKCHSTTCPLVFVAGGCGKHGCSDAQHGLQGEQWQPTVDAVETFDPSTAMWNTSYPPLPQPRAMMGLGAMSGKLYAVGGIRGGNATRPCSGHRPGCSNPGTPLNTVECFDPDKPSAGWTSVPSGGRSLVLPQPRWGMGVATFKQTLYIVGGFVPGNGPALGKPDGRSYLLALDSPLFKPFPSPTDSLWPEPPSSCGERALAGVAVLSVDWCRFTKSSKSVPRCGTELPVLMVVGGQNSIAALASVFAYSLVFNEWHEMAPLPEDSNGRLGNRTGHSVAVLGTVEGKDQRLYVVGGRGFDFTFTSGVDMYDPDKHTWTTIAAQSLQRTQMGAAVLSGAVWMLDGGRKSSGSPIIDGYGDVSTLDCRYSPPRNPGQPIVTVVDCSKKQASFAIVKRQGAILPMKRAATGTVVAMVPCTRCSKDICCCDTSCKTRTIQCCNLWRNIGVPDAV